MAYRKKTYTKGRSYGTRKRATTRSGVRGKSASYGTKRRSNNQQTIRLVVETIAAPSGNAGAGMSPFTVAPQATPRITSRF